MQYAKNHSKNRGKVKNISHQEIDEIDQALIRLLSQNARITNAQLAQETGIAQSTCISRVRALVSKGIIQICTIPWPNPVKTL
mgnify:CR=1 FL=1